MKKKLMLGIITFALLLANGMNVFAAPEIMQDGTMFDAEYYAQNNPDVVAVFGADKSLLYSHYVNCGKAEGRQGFQITKDMYTICPVASQQTLELLATGGQKGIHYKAQGNCRYYKLGDKGGNWGELALTRTDFPDGLLDLDGNGLDDRDPINCMGFVDLNLNGIDDRTIMWYGLGDPNATDLAKYPLCTRSSFDYDNYLCEHGVVCSTGNNVAKVCLVCKAVDDAKAADYARRHSGHVSEDMGYRIGSTVTGSTRDGIVTLTYQGNDIWRGSDGYNWYAYLGVDNEIHWETGIR